MNRLGEDLRSIPKVELHRHLEMSLRLSTLADLARQAGIAVPPTPEGLREKFLCTEPMRDLAAVLQKFVVTAQVLATPEAITRLTRECIEDAVAEGIRILELRYAPTFIQSAQPHLSFETIFAAVEAGIAQTRHLPIAVGHLLTIQRILSLAHAERVVDFAIAHRCSARTGDGTGGTQGGDWGGIHGIDLADSEVGFEARLFARVFERARAAGLGITIHSGEAIYPESARSVRVAIEELGAKRIGHGVQIYQDESVMEFVKSAGVPLELCPTSNWLTNAVPSLKAHPFRRLMEFGVPVTINSDDPGVFAIDLTNEYELLARDHGFTREEFDRCNDTAAAASFIPLAEKQKHWPRPITLGQ